MEEVIGVLQVSLGDGSSLVWFLNENAESLDWAEVLTIQNQVLSYFIYVIFNLHPFFYSLNKIFFFNPFHRRHIPHFKFVKQIVPISMKVIIIPFLLFLIKWLLLSFIFFIFTILVFA
jgi:hypothetical protein